MKIQFLFRFFPFNDGKSRDIFRKRIVIGMRQSYPILNLIFIPFMQYRLLAYCKIILKIVIFYFE